MAKIVIIAGLANSLLNFRRELIEQWLSAGHQVVAAAPEANVKPELEQMGAGYRVIPLKRTGLNFFHDTWLFIKLIFLLYREKPDYLFLYTIKPVIYGSWAAYFRRKTKVFTMITGLGYVFTGESSGLRALLKSMIRLMYKVALARSEKVFFQNPDDRREFTGSSLVSEEKSVLVNGSGVNLEKFKPAPLPEETVSFLLIARLLWDKGIREYVQAARRVKARHPQATFKLVGRFDNNPSAVRKAEVEGWVEEGVLEYGGEVKDVRPVIAEANVYVLPSYREGTPRTVLEAMAMGRPVITTDAPGCRETVTDGVNGFLVPVKAEQALAEAMEKFIAEPGLIGEMGKESRRIAEEKYDVRKINQNILETMGLK